MFHLKISPASLIVLLFQYDNPRLDYEIVRVFRMKNIGIVSKKIDSRDIHYWESIHRILIVVLNQIPRHSIAKSVNFCEQYLSDLFVEKKHKQQFINRIPVLEFDYESHINLNVPKVFISSRVHMEEIHAIYSCKYRMKSSSTAASIYTAKGWLCFSTRSRPHWLWYKKIV